MAEVCTKIFPPYQLLIESCMKAQEVVKGTGKKQLIIAGVVTEVCVAFPALWALEEGFEVLVVTDASGTFNEMTRYSAWDRMSAAGAQLMTWFAAVCERRRWASGQGWASNGEVWPVPSFVICNSNRYKSLFFPGQRPLPTLLKVRKSFALKSGQ